ncbi:MAG: PQQ-dependent sugar dehydrogenase [Planctomycetota bacterium]
MLPRKRRFTNPFRRNRSTRRDASTARWTAGPLEKRELLAADLGSLVSIEAAGFTGEEEFRLLVDQAEVARFTADEGLASQGQFQRFQYQSETSLAADQVRVEFLNDAYRPAENFDRNLRVNFVEIDGVRFQSEAANVFSTGTWRPEDGIVPGFREREVLHTNGYFQFAGPGVDGQTVIDVFIAGDEGDESFGLIVDDVEVQRWERVGGDRFARQFESFRFVSDDVLDDSAVGIRLLNDRYEPGVVDRNLTVDRIAINGVDFQAESLRVFSDATWQNGAIVPGFRTSERIHSGGTMQFGVDGAQPGTLALATSNITVNESAGTAQIEVLRSGGSDGVAGVEYAVLPGSAEPGRDFAATTGRLTFFDQQTRATIEVPILDDAVAEPTESFNITIDNPTIAPLLVPRTATITILDDDVELPNFENFASAQSASDLGLSFNGEAETVSGELQLTGQDNNTAGSSFFETPINLAGDASFRSSFAFRIDGGSGGADGLAFVIQNDPRGPAAVGDSGGGLGLDGIENAVAVEWDTYENPFDPSANHVSILQNTTDNALATAEAPLDLNSGSPVFAWVDYNGDSDVLAVYVSDQDVQPEIALLKTTVDLAAVVGPEAWFGLSAGTGGLTNRHRVLQWSLDLQTPPADPPVDVQGDVVAVDLVSGLTRPTAIEWLPGGEALIAQQNGVVRMLDADGNLIGDPLLDLRDIVNGTRDRGLLDIAVHPEFATNPYLYLLYTYDPPEVNDFAAGTLAGPDGRGNRAGRLTRVTLQTNGDQLGVVPDSEVVLLGTNSTWENFDGQSNSTFDFDVPPAGEDADGNYLRDFIPSDSESHTIGSLAFAPDGALFVSVGDGASYNRVDVRADRVQDIDSLSGKILRVDPISGRGLTDNPFYNGDPDANRSKVYQVGLRNPFRISVDDSMGQLYVGDVGWTRWEEINAGGPGANFGWPYYEGGNGESLVQDRYADTPEGQAFFAGSIPVDAPALALNHAADGINAIVVGDVYRGSAYGSRYSDGIFYNDLGQGIVRFASINAGGALVNPSTFATGANVVVAMREGPDGRLYYVDLDDGTVGRWELA